MSVLRLVMEALFKNAFLDKKGAVCKSLLNIFAHETLPWVWPQRVEWDLKGSIKPQDIALPDIRTFGQEIKVSSCVGNQVEDIKGLCCAGPSL